MESRAWYELNIFGGQYVQKLPKVWKKNLKLISDAF